MNAKRLSLITLTLLALVSCTTIDQGTYGSEFKAKTPTMEFPQSSEVFISKDGETMDISFLCTRDWKAAWKEDWISLIPASGKGSDEAQTLHLVIGGNSEFIRSANISFTAGYPLAATLTIRQDGAPMPDPELSLTPESMHVNAADTETKFIVDATRDWVISCEDKRLSITPISGSIGRTEVTVNFPANKEEKEVISTCSVSLMGEPISATFTLVQEAAGPDPNRKYYALVKERPESFDGRYLAIYQDGDSYYVMNPNDIGSVKAKYASPAEVSLEGGEIEATASIDKMAFSIMRHKKLGEGWYSFVRSDGMFFYGGAEDKSEFLTKDTETANGSTITYIEDGNFFSMCYRGTNPLIFHKSNKAFVFIKKSNAGNSDCGAIQLFKRYGPEE